MEVLFTRKTRFQDEAKVSFNHTSNSSPCKYKLLRLVRSEDSHMETKRGAKNWVHSVLTHNQLPLCVFLEVPPDFANGPVVTVRCLSKT